MGSLAVMLNMMQLFVLLRRGKELKIYETFVLSLCIADLLSGTLSLIANPLLHENPKEMMAVGFTFLSSSLWNSLVNSSFLTLDRLIAIRWPIKHRQIMHRSRARKMIIGSWVLCLGIVIGVAVRTAASLLKLRHLVGYFLFPLMLLALLFQVLSYLNIISTIKRNNRAIPTHRLNQRNIRNKQERKVLFFCVAIVASFVLTIVPVTIYMLIIPIKGLNSSFTCQTHGQYQPIIMTCLLANSSANSLIYLLMTGCRRTSMMMAQGGS